MRINASLLKAVLFIGLVLLPAPSYAAIDAVVSVNLFSPPPIAVAPPPLPVYVIPPPPVEGVLWAPGHWRWGPYGYFWVPGTWVQPPIAGVLWTPGYWGWNSGSFFWHEGYWGPHVGFYGGINYGGGYGGRGFNGGEWHGGAFEVNRSVTNVNNVNVTNVYNRSASSFNGGPGGTSARPTSADQIAAHEHHTPITAEQRTHAQTASRNPALAASTNHGRPSIAATDRGGDFSHGVVPAHQAGARNSVAEQHNAAVRKDPSMVHEGAVLNPHMNAGSPNAHGGPSRAQHAPTVGPRPPAQPQHPAMHEEHRLPEQGHPEGQEQGHEPAPGGGGDDHRH